jgi:hypothetical protein
LLVTVAGTTAVWVTTTLLTQPADAGTLQRFYELVRPAGPGWEPVRKASGLAPSRDSLPQAMLGWVLGCAFVYSALFGVGALLYGRTAQGAVFAVVCVLSGIGVFRVLRGFWAADAAELSETAPRRTSKA